MEAIGGIIIFFSWVLTNTFHQNYMDLKKSLDSAKGTFRLYNTLHELRAMINSVAAEVIQRHPNENEASRFISGKHSNADIEGIKHEFSRTYLSAQQVKELMAFTTEVHALSIATDDASSTHKKIQNIMNQVGELTQRHRQFEQAAENELNRSNTFTDVSQFEAINTYIEVYKREILPQVPKFYTEIAGLSNTRQE